MRRSILTKIFLWLGAGALAGYLFWWGFPQYLMSWEDPRSEEHLNRIAAELNWSVPVMIDQETELLPVGAAPGMLIYNYRLVNYTASQIDAKKFAAGAKQHIAEGACNRPETRDDFLKKGVTLRYAYFDKNKQPITSFDVTPADCGF